MNAVAANGVSCSLVAPSLGRRRCSISTSSNSLGSSLVRLPKQQQQLVSSVETKKTKPCAAVENMHRTSADIDRSVQPEVSSPAFQDEERCAEQGIRCYHAENGEITCEGFDEGPHFHPIARVQQRTVMMNASHMSLLTRGISLAPSAAPAAEVSVYTVVEEEGRGECYCEGKDES